MRKPDPYKQKGVRYTGEVLEEEGRKDRGEVAPGAKDSAERSSMKIKTTKDRRKRISLRQRKRINGTPERPRLRVFRSVSHIYAQVHRRPERDDAGLGVEHRAGAQGAPRRAAATSPGAKALGKTIAERLKEKGIKRVVFDRGGYPLPRSHQGGGGSARVKRVWSFNVERGTGELEHR